jgi:hypothetical protein
VEWGDTMASFPLMHSATSREFYGSRSAWSF